jgi:hypothetical protein
VFFVAAAHEGVKLIADAVSCLLITILNNGALPVLHFVFLNPERNNLQFLLEGSKAHLKCLENRNFLLLTRKRNLFMHALSNQ